MSNGQENLTHVQKKNVRKIKKDDQVVCKLEKIEELMKDMLSDINRAKLENNMKKKYIKILKDIATETMELKHNLIKDYKTMLSCHLMMMDEAKTKMEADAGIESLRCDNTIHNQTFDTNMKRIVTVFQNTAKVVVSMDTKLAKKWKCFTGGWLVTLSGVGVTGIFLILHFTPAFPLVLVCDLVIALLAICTVCFGGITVFGTLAWKTDEQRSKLNKWDKDTRLENNNLLESWDENMMIFDSPIFKYGNIPMMKHKIQEFINRLQARTHETGNILAGP